MNNPTTQTSQPILIGEKQMIIIADRARQLRADIQSLSDNRWDFEELNQAGRESYDHSLLDNLHVSLSEVKTAITDFYADEVADVD